MYIAGKNVHTEECGHFTYYDLNDVTKGIAELFDSAEFPPALKFTVDIEKIKEELLSGKLSYWHTINLEFERSFSVHVRLSIELRESKRTFTCDDRKLQEYSLTTEFNTCGTNYDLKSAIALNTLHARVIEFASVIECMFVNYPVCRTTMKESTSNENN